MLDSKRALGVSYFVGLGLGLIVSLLGYVLLVNRATDIGSIGTLTAIGWASTLPYVGYWLQNSDFSDAAVWGVARWCAGGVAVPTLFVGAVLVTGVRPRLVIQFPHLLVNLVAAGGVVGTLLGLIWELRRQYARVDELNRRNTVLNRIMRHDIQNDVSVIDGYIDRIADEADDVDEELLAPIERKSEEIMETSQVARHVGTLRDEDQTESIDAVDVVSTCLAGIQTTHPDATIQTDLPEEAWVEAGELLRVVITNLVENAIEHTDRSPTVTVTVIESTPGQVTLCIADNGPGMPESAQEVLTAETVPEATERSGLGLWLVRWIVDHYDGTIRVRGNDPRGTVVEVVLPTPSAQERWRPDGSTGVKGVM